MTDLLDSEHQRRFRAEYVSTMLRAFWGETGPAQPLPELNVLIDVIAIDDEHAVARRLVSHGDGLSYSQLIALATFQSSTPPLPPSLAPLLPPPQQTGARLAEPTPNDSTMTGNGHAEISVRSPTPLGAAPGSEVGMWEVDARTEMVAYDAVSAALLGREAVAGCVSMQTSLQGIHPVDRTHVEHALRYALRTGATYRARFRVVSAGGVDVWLVSHGSMLKTTSTADARLIGCVIIDPTTNPSTELVDVA